jgi:aspartate/methionine/tyrosine aminotransferase
LAIVVGNAAQRWSPDLRLPQVADSYERGISLNVMSKSYGLPGLRIGWLACRDQAALSEFERYKHFLMRDWLTRRAS